MAINSEHLREGVSPLCATCPLGLQNLEQGVRLSEEEEDYAKHQCAAWKLILDQTVYTAACMDHMGFVTSTEVGRKGKQEQPASTLWNIVFDLIDWFANQ